MEKISKFLNDNNFPEGALAFVESKTGIKRKFLFAGSFTLLWLYLVIGYGSSFIVALFGFLYPAYASTKAIESAEKKDDTQWLTYWVVYAVFNIAEFCSDILLSWLPFYLVFKVLFLGWCMAPFSWNGADFIYATFIRQFVMEHSDRVDDLLTDAKAVAKDLYDHAENAKDAAVEQILTDEKND